MSAEFPLFEVPDPIGVPTAEDVQRVFEEIWRTSVRISNLTRLAKDVERGDETSESLAGYEVRHLLEYFEFLQPYEGVVAYLRIAGTVPVRLAGLSGVSGHDLVFVLMRKILTEFCNKRIEYCALLEDTPTEADVETDYLQDLRDGVEFVAGSPFVIFDVLEECLQFDKWHRDKELLRTQLRAEREDALRKIDVIDERNGKTDRDAEWCGPQSPSEWEKVFSCSWKTIRRRADKGQLQLKRLHSKSYYIAQDDLPKPPTES